MSLFELPRVLFRKSNGYARGSSGVVVRRRGKYIGALGNDFVKLKLMGGFGFLDLANFNRALLTKHCWRILKNPSSLAAKVLKGNCYPRYGILEIGAKATHLYLWRILVWGKGLLETGLCWRIGDYASVFIYEYMWLPKPTSSKVMYRLKIGVHVMVKRLLSDTSGWKVKLVKKDFHEVDADSILSSGGLDSGGG
ncbi:hypothetical protein Dsin_012028 [Dipteronia sinensis]|uniref:Uncharacterized protein n=1 Tax=Dipteronia sinensis TaxID=43782 RepID=A0AAE0AHQ9_9ROSI|nr:hypothetical protein Dsin_012028 [Dipteronia sinensis]